MMNPVPPREENPCRPRHYKPDPCGPAPLEGPARQSLDVSHTRLLITAALFCLAFAIICVRLVGVTIFGTSDVPFAHRDPTTRPAHFRADIVDRNGVLLASTLETPSLFADSKQILDAKSAARQLHRVLPDLDEADVAAKLASGKGFIWIKRQLTPQEEVAVNRLGIPGLEFRDEGKRVYPKGNLFAHVVGYTNTDGKGLAGIERGLDQRLRRGGAPIQLSVDTRLQYILHDETEKAVSQFDAIGGMGIIMDVNTGEVLAMVSLPDFDPNQIDKAKPDELFNRITLGDYEMGSVMKIFTVAMALDSHTTTMEGGYDATYPIHIGGFTIHDDHAQRRWLSVPEIFMYSSNIGAAKMATAAGADLQREYLARFGLMKAPQFQLRELAAPLVPAVWRPVNTMTIAFGHGMSVSPLQVATGVSAAVNGGVMHPATLLKQPEGEPVPGKRVIAPETSIDMRKLLRLVVEHGTGSLAKDSGYLIGGKTGTAEKVAGRRYLRHELLSSFVGVFPINNPRYVVLISIDEPHGDKQTHGFATGGWVAAPAVKDTIERMASIVGIQPVDENSPEIRRSLMVDLPLPQGRKLAAN
ncbi:MAG TPA: penicillin-binding protein 2 [Stellaceae bacterium]|nr:penicillin-binding protein 2 [Stellaceae bacterium]